MTIANVGKGCARGMAAASMLLGAVRGFAENASAPSPPSLLRNGGFEEVDPATSAPRHWTFGDWSPPDQRGTIAVISEIGDVPEGTRAARIRYEGSGQNLVLVQDVARSGAGSYVLRVLCQPAPGRQAYASLVTLGGGKTIQYLNTKRVTGDGHWHKLELALTASPETEKIRVILRANGEAMFDDAKFAQVPGGTDAQTEPSAGLELEQKAAAVAADAADAVRKAAMSPEELAWEKVLEENLGSFYLPRYKEVKAKGGVTAWDFVHDKPGLSRILIIGDSISRGYTSAVRTALADKVNVHRAPANCGSTTLGLRKLDVWLGDGRWDLITFNFGIHDRNTSTEDYVTRLEQIVDRLEHTGAKLLWVTSTPLPPNTDAYPTDECVRLNRAAAGVMEARGIPTLDLHAAVMPVLGEYQLPNDCHFNGAGYTFMGGLVAERILAGLEPR